MNGEHDSLRLLRVIERQQFRPLSYVLGRSESHLIVPTGTVPATLGTNVDCPANTVRTVRFALLAPVLVASIHFRVTTLAAGALGGVAIYSPDGNTLLINGGGQSLAATGNVAVTLSSAVLLNIGMYRFAYTSSNGNVRFWGVATDANFALFNSGVTQVGVAANASAAGVFPSTLGAITPAALGYPLVKLQS